MSAFEVHSHLPGSGLLSVMLRALKKFADGIVHGRQLHRDYVHLSAMSDPELQDIGITRSDIFAVVAGTYRNARRPVATSRKRTPDGEKNSR
jgi:uncharacterized protein YjiS (DUF1127 family)